MAEGSRSEPEEAGHVRELALLIDQVVDYAIFMLGPEGHVLTWNRGAQRAKGYTAEDIIGQHFSRFYTPEDRARKHPDHELEVASRVGRFEEEGWRVRKDGGRFWANVVITALRDPEGRLVGFAKVTRDLTERRQAMEDLRAAQAELARSNTDLEAFASAAAHDLREPIRTARSFTQVLRTRHGDDLPESGRDLTERLDRTLGRAQTLVDELLTFARSGGRELSREPMPPAEAVGQALESVAAAIEARSARIEIDLSELPEVSADPALLPLVVQNLVANALKFTEGAAPKVRIRGERRDGVARVAVSDDGVGIPADQQERIFESFTRMPGGPQAGAGLGLAICRRIVEQHGGAIGVDSEPGRGSTFWFTLPDGPAAAGP